VDARFDTVIAVRTFRDDDEGYLTWLHDHPDDFVLNAGRQPRPTYLRLHRATCPTITGAPSRGRRWTADYIKVCGRLDELTAWATGAAHGEAQPCPVCR
jgi:hypothetical protein